MFDACTDGNLRQFNELVAKGINLHQTNSGGNSYLHVAAYNGHLGLVQELLGAGLGVNARGRGKCTALHFAALKGHREVAEYLVGSGADVAIKDGQGKTAYDVTTNIGLRQYLLKYLFPRSAAPAAGDAGAAQQYQQPQAQQMMAGHSQCGYSLAEGAVRPDGFVSSANDPKLQKLYGHQNVYADAVGMSTAPPTAPVPTGPTQHVAQGAAGTNYVVPNMFAASTGARSYAPAPAAAFAGTPVTANAQQSFAGTPVAASTYQQPAQVGAGFGRQQQPSTATYTSVGFGRPAATYAPAAAAVAAPAQADTKATTGHQYTKPPQTMGFGQAPQTAAGFAPQPAQTQGAPQTVGWNQQQQPAAPQQSATAGWGQQPTQQSTTAATSWLPQN